MEAWLLPLPLRLLLLVAAILIVSAADTADLVELCGQTWQGDGLPLRSHAASRRFYFVAPDTDCKLWVRAAASRDRIRFQFRFFLVYSLTPGSTAPRAPPASNATSPEPTYLCFPGSYLQFYEGPSGAPRPLGDPLCGLTIPAWVASSGPLLGLRLVTRGLQPCLDFVGEVTSFRVGPLSWETHTLSSCFPSLSIPGSCGAYFQCQNGMCIPPSLVCDPWAMDNCGDGSDQASWPPASCRALGSAGPLRTAAERIPTTRPDSEQDTAWEGSRRQGAALASLLLLASAGLLGVGLLWCCCSSSRLACWAGACGRGLSCTVCYLSPGWVAPGGLQQPGPDPQGQQDALWRSCRPWA